MTSTMCFNCKIEPIVTIAPCPVHNGKTWRWVHLSTFDPYCDSRYVGSHMTHEATPRPSTGQLCAVVRVERSRHA